MFHFKIFHNEIIMLNVIQIVYYNNRESSTMFCFEIFQITAKNIKRMFHIQILLKY